MYKVVYTAESLRAIDTYIMQYTSYFEQLYSDSGIWSVDQIIEQYRREWYARYDEIIDVITHTLQSNITTYMQNQTIIRWRSKVILVSWEDDGDSRIITSLEIR